MNRDFWEVQVNQSTMDAIPIANGEAVLYDSTRVKPGNYNMELDPATGLYVATGTYLNSIPDVKGAMLSLLVTTQAVTFKLYWWIGGAFTLVNGSGKSVVAGTPLGEVVPFGGAGTKLTYLAGATPPATAAARVGLRRTLEQPVVTTV